MITLQVDAELAAATTMFRRVKPTRILEIGVYQGGTLKTWLENCEPDSTVVAVDPAHVNPELYSEWAQPETTLIRLDGVSQDAGIAALIRHYGPYDWVFIDGDHGYNSVRADVDLCLPLVREGGHLLLHDIVDSDGVTTYDPGHVLNELEAAGRTVARVVKEPHAGYDGAHGIGVVYL